MTNVENSDWNNMVEFAVKLINRSYKLKKGSIVDKRIAIMHLDHATELLMKAYLLKEQYLIYRINQKKINKGIKRDAAMHEYFHAEKTIGFSDALNIVIKKVGLGSTEREVFEQFHRIRNEIQHRALNLDLDKAEEIDKFVPHLSVLYEKMFPEEWGWYNITENKQVTRIKLHHRNIKL